MAAAAPPSQPKELSNTKTTYFFTFGDSYSQSGFDVTGVQPSPSDPMGNPALGAGLNWIEDLVTVDNSSLILGYDLAVGGATIDNHIVNATVPDVVTQVGSFQTYYDNKPASAPWSSNDVVFGFWIGINDVGRAFSSYNASDTVPLLINKYQSVAEELYSDGGRKFLFLNVPPTSRSPYILDQGPDVVAAHAAWLKVFNEGLSSMVKDFGAKHRDATPILYDSWSFMTNVLDHPHAYGYPNATCINDDGISCVWWNNYHPGQKYHKLQAADMKKYLHPFGAW
ncbi:hypothetical protein N7510_011551 [Penicillium lagena]|uniref:uncharacterized protein n=1 Tax=Penicillium lagena TaxID=94218 RepID=UPI0025414925|nr:uncharacterized protein N7510_011551 [Penicillium lagena]KAJ5602017.1 hypothetical protein N7510_011551 [Penicillium lagena]